MIKSAVPLDRILDSRILEDYFYSSKAVGWLPKTHFNLNFQPGNGLTILMLLFWLTAEQDDETPESSTDNISNGRSIESSPGPWFDRILGAFSVCFVFKSC